MIIVQKNTVKVGRLTGDKRRAAVETETVSEKPCQYAVSVRNVDTV